MNTATAAKDPYKMSLRTRKLVVRKAGNARVGTCTCGWEGTPRSRTDAGVRLAVRDAREHSCIDDA